VRAQQYCIPKGRNLLEDSTPCPWREKKSPNVERVKYYVLMGRENRAILQEHNTVYTVLKTRKILYVVKVQWYCTWMLAHKNLNNVTRTQYRYRSCVVYCIVYWCDQTCCELNPQCFEWFKKNFSKFITEFNSRVSIRVLNNINEKFETDPFTLVSKKNRQSCDHGPASKSIRKFLNRGSSTLSFSKEWAVWNVVICYSVFFIENW
jgi:hypothetical protein